MPKPPLADRDFHDAAASLGCDVATVRAVAEVEAPRGAFDERDRPSILFEPHIFGELTAHRFDNAVAGGLSGAAAFISRRAWKRGTYGTHSAQWLRLRAAEELDATAAHKATSWGAFQILGRYHAEAGHRELSSFTGAMWESAAAQLAAFVALVKYRDLDAALAARDWPAFALRYNGKGYKLNRYDEKLASAWAKWAGLALA